MRDTFARDDRTFARDEGTFARDDGTFTRDEGMFARTRPPGPLYCSDCRSALQLHVGILHSNSIA